MKFTGLMPTLYTRDIRRFGGVLRHARCGFEHDGPDGSGVALRATHDVEIMFAWPNAAHAVRGAGADFGSLYLRCDDVDRRVGEGRGRGAHLLSDRRFRIYGMRRIRRSSTTTDICCSSARRSTRRRELDQRPAASRVASARAAARQRRRRSRTQTTLPREWSSCLQALRGPVLFAASSIMSR